MSGNEFMVLYVLTAFLGPIGALFTAYGFPRGGRWAIVRCTVGGVVSLLVFASIYTLYSQMM